MISDLYANIIYVCCLPSLNQMEMKNVLFLQDGATEHTKQRQWLFSDRISLDISSPWRVNCNGQKVTIFKRYLKSLSTIIVLALNWPEKPHSSICRQHAYRYAIKSRPVARYIFSTHPWYSMGRKHSLVMLI